MKKLAIPLYVLSLLLIPRVMLAADIGISWQDMSTDETGFKVERQANGGSFASLPSCDVGANVQACQDANVTVGVSYCYKAFSYNGAGGSAYSNTACITPAATTPTPPAVLSCTQTANAAALAAPVLALNFNAGSGTTATDGSGNNNHGTLTNGPTWTNNGKYGKAILFDGTNDIVLIPDSASLDLTTAMTLEAWVYPTVTVTYWKAILQKQTDAYLLSAGSDANVPAFGGTFSGVCCTNVTAPAVLAVHTWTHIAGTYDGTTERLYINGVQVATRAASGTLQVNTNPLRIGGNSYGTEFFKGRIDDVRIYNRALSAAEITTDKNTAIP